MRLPVVSECLLEAMVGQVGDGTVKGALDRMRSENPKLLGFLIGFSAGEDAALMAGVFVYQILSAQAEALEMEVLFGDRAK